MTNGPYDPPPAPPEKVGRPVRDAADRIAEAAEAMRDAIQGIRSSGVRIRATKTASGDYAIVIEENRP
jgi:hypothetical protein